MYYIIYYGNKGFVYPLLENSSSNKLMIFPTKKAAEKYLEDHQEISKYFCTQISKLR